MAKFHKTLDILMLKVLFFDFVVAPPPPHTHLQHSQNCGAKWLGLKNRLFNSGDSSIVDVERWGDCDRNFSLACAAMSAFVTWQTTGVPLCAKDVTARIDMCRSCSGSSVETCRALIEASQTSSTALISAVQTLLYCEENLLVYVDT